MRLGVNIDHIAYLRETRKINDPDPLEAIFIAKRAGANQITIHLREDRRHIHDSDVIRIIESSFLPVNVECAIASDIVDFLCDIKPYRITLVPEKRDEVTTEGGLLVGNHLLPIIQKFYDNDIDIALFIDADSKAVVESAKLANAIQTTIGVELHTGRYANISLSLESNLSRTQHSIKEFEISRRHLQQHLNQELENTNQELRNQNQELKQDIKNSMQEHYNKALKLEKAGMLAKVERLHAEMALTDAEKSLDTSIREARLVESSLKSMLSSNDDNITPATPLFIIKAEDIEALMYFQDMASTANAKLKQVQSAKKLARAGVINSTSSFIPKINAFGMVSIYDYQFSSLSPDYMVGVQMSLNLFDGLQNYHQLKASKQTEESTKLLAARAEKDIRTLVEQQYITMENARADHEASLKSLAFTEEYLRARQKAFNQGMATSLDVVDAELALSNSKMSAIQAAYKFDMALINMLSTAGMFDSFESYRAKAFVEPGLK